MVVEEKISNDNSFFNFSLLIIHRFNLARHPNLFRLPARRAKESFGSEYCPITIRKRVANDTCSIPAHAAP